MDVALAMVLVLLLRLSGQPNPCPANNAVIAMFHRRPMELDEAIDAARRSGRWGDVAEVLTRETTDWLTETTQFCAVLANRSRVDFVELQRAVPALKAAWGAYVTRRTYVTPALAACISVLSKCLGSSGVSESC